MRKLSVEQTLKALAWLGVVAWCLAPLVILAIQSVVQAFQTPPVQSLGRFSPGPMGTEGTLSMLGVYGVWCASGVVCAIGACRACEVWIDAIAAMKSR
jgi:hypothetical protein